MAKRFWPVVLLIAFFSIRFFGNIYTTVNNEYGFWKEIVISRIEYITETARSAKEFADSGLAVMREIRSMFDNLRFRLDELEQEVQTLRQQRESEQGKPTSLSNSSLNRTGELKFQRFH